MSGTTGARSRTRRVSPTAACSSPPRTRCKMPSQCGSALWSSPPPSATESYQVQGVSGWMWRAKRAFHLADPADDAVPDELLEPDDARVVAVGGGVGVLDAGRASLLVEPPGDRRGRRERLVPEDVAAAIERRLDHLGVGAGRRGDADDVGLDLVERLAASRSRRAAPRASRPSPARPTASARRSPRSRRRSRAGRSCGLRRRSRRPTTIARSPDPSVDARPVMVAACPAPSGPPGAPSSCRRPR